MPYANLFERINNIMGKKRKHLFLLMYRQQQCLITQKRTVYKQDDYDMLNKKTIESKIVDTGIRQKTYGPFTDELPNPIEDNMYKFLMYALLKNKFTMLLGDYIDS